MSFWNMICADTMRKCVATTTYNRIVKQFLRPKKSYEFDMVVTGQQPTRIELNIEQHSELFVINVVCLLNQIGVRLWTHNLFAQLRFVNTVKFANIRRSGFCMNSKCIHI